MRERRIAKLRRDLGRYGFRLVRITQPGRFNGSFYITDLRTVAERTDYMSLEDAEAWLVEFETEIRPPARPRRARAGLRLVT